MKLSFDAKGTATGSSSVSPVMAQGCLTLFGLPFAGVGLFVLWQAVTLLQRHDLPQAAALGGFGAIFGTVGFGLMIAGVRARRETAARLTREAAAPGQPWLWREDWANRRIEDRGRSTTGGLWLFAVFWNVIALPATYLAFRNGIDASTRPRCSS